MQQNEYVNSKNAKEMLGVSTKTLRVWDKENKLGTIRVPSGQRRYNLKDIKNIIGCSSNDGQKKKICYCRVSSPKQTDDLERQKTFFRDRYPGYDLVTDVGSGINWKRKGLRTILEQAMRGNIEELVVAHRDRLCRFAFDLLEWILVSRGVKLVVHDKDENKSSDNELSDDILSIIHVYSCRKMGQRRYNKIKKNEVLSIKHAEENTQTVDGK